MRRFASLDAIPNGVDGCPDVPSLILDGIRREGHESILLKSTSQVQNNQPRPTERERAMPREEASIAKRSEGMGADRRENKRETRVSVSRRILRLYERQPSR